MSLTKQMQAFVRVTIRQVGGSPFLWQASVMPLPDDESYYDGFKPGLVLGWGDVERALSDRSGAYEVPTFSFDVDDRSGFWRGLLADPVTQYLTASDVAFFLCSPEGRAAGALPRPGFRGQLEKPTLLSGRKFRINAQSRLGTRYGPINLQGPVLKRTYNSVANGGDFPNETFPRNSEGLPVRFLWGEKSFAGVTNENGEEVVDAAMTVVNCGKHFLGSTPGTPPTSPSYLPDPPAPNVEKIGPGGTHTWTFAASVRTVNGHTRLGATTTVTGLPGDGNFTGESDEANAYPTNGAIISLTPYSNALMAQVTGADLWVKRGNADSPYKWNKVDAAGQMFNTPSKKWFAGPEDGYYANGDDHFHKGGTPPTTNTAQITPGDEGTDPQSIFYTFWGFTGHKSKITKIIASNLAQEPAYAAVSESEIGEDWTSGKNFLLGTDGEAIELVLNGRSYFGFYAKGPKNEAAETGPFPFKVNGCGWPEDDDFANPIIDQTALVYQDVFTQLGGNDGQGYQTGARLTIPSFDSEPTIPVIKSSTFFAVQETLKAFLGNDKGYVSCVELNDLSLTWDQFIQKMNFEHHLDTGETHQGQLMLSVMDDTVSPTAGEVFRQFTHIVRVDDPGAVDESRLLNIYDFEFDPDLNGKYRSGIQQLKDDVSIRMYGPRRTPNPIKLDFIRDRATAFDAVARRMMDESTGPMYPAVTLKQRKATQIELGDQIQLVHDDLLVPTGIPLYVKRYRHAVRQGTIYISGRDRRGTYSQGAAPDGDDYTDSSEADRLTYAFATDEDGLNPDGTPGARAV